MSRLMALFPKSWRERYGDEVVELLADSRTPVRDRADIILAAVRVRLDAAQLAPEEVIVRTHLAAAALVVLGAVGGMWAAANLTDGVVEIPGHWWSSLAVAPLLAGGLLELVTWRRRSSR
jgi:hypothetical protein